MTTRIGDMTLCARCHRAIQLRYDNMHGGYWWHLRAPEPSREHSAIVPAFLTDRLQDREFSPMFLEMVRCQAMPGWDALCLDQWWDHDCEVIVQRNPLRAWRIRPTWPALLDGYVHGSALSITHDRDEQLETS